MTDSHEWHFKKTLIIGASTNPSRYAYLACNRLVDAGHPVVLIGKNVGQIRGIDIHTKAPDLSDIHTVTMYIRPSIQSMYLDYLLGLNPKRVIFNPGTENPSLQRRLSDSGIDVLEACTLFLLATNAY